MDFCMHVDQLNRDKGIIRDLVANISQEQAVWRPAETRWTLLEAINHLLDIETEDFRHDLELILFHPEDSWPNFSIERWRIERKYNERNLEESIQNFIGEREKSVKWLKEMKSPDLNAVHSGKGFEGEKMRAGDVLISWVAHDLFHIRQLSLLCWDILNEWSKPFSPEYSGFES